MECCHVAFSSLDVTVSLMFPAEINGSSTTGHTFRTLFGVMHGILCPAHVAVSAFANDMPSYPMRFDHHRGKDGNSGVTAKAA